MNELKDINKNGLTLSAENIIVPALNKSLAQAIKDRDIQVPSAVEEEIDEIKATHAFIKDVVVNVSEGDTASGTATFSEGTLTLNLVSVKGADGTPGADGKSAYEVAVANGFEGTEAEWLASLKGQDGKGSMDADAIDTTALSNSDEKVPSSKLVKSLLANKSSDTAVDASNICDYYDNNIPFLRDLNNLKYRYNSNAEFMGVFFSDVHGSQKNVSRIIDFCNHFAEAGISLIINGGDTCNYYASETLAWYNKLTQKSNLTLLTAVGNHDAWTTNFGVWGTGEDCYNLVTKEVKTLVPSIVQPDNAETDFCNYYYYDKSGIRFIVITSMMVSGGDKYYDDAQDTWLKSVLTDAITQGLPVLCINHMPFAHTDVNVFDSNWCSPAYADSSFSQDTNHISDLPLTDVDDFINAGGVFIGWLFGHSHKDCIFTSKSHPKQFGFVTTSANYGKNYHDEAQTSLSEKVYDFDIFNLFVIDTTRNLFKLRRIGLDTNMYMQDHRYFCWDYAKRKLVASR